MFKGIVLYVGSYFLPLRRLSLALLEKVDDFFTMLVCILLYTVVFFAALFQTLCVLKREVDKNIIYLHSEPDWSRGGRFE